MIKRLLTLALLALPALPLAAQNEEAQNEEAQREYTLDLPLVDWPFNRTAPWSNPSMRQSLALTAGYYDILHTTLEKRLRLRPRSQSWRGFGSRMAFLGIDLLLLAQFPLGQAWLHEEWHRAVMAHRGVASFNDVYLFNWKGTTINVSHETDADLERLKRDHNEDQVRLAAAGMEAEQRLRLRLEEDQFFARNQPYHGALYALIDASTIGYMRTCNSTETDDLTDEGNAKEGAAVEKRDFIGMDCTGWVRDLNRPQEPYEARGIHPSGVGFNRYTKYSDLDRDEKDYLHRSLTLSYLNLIDPFLFGAQAFEGRELFGEGEAVYQGTMSNILTSFGTDTAAHLFYRAPTLKGRMSLHAYQNRRHTFPGLELSLLSLPLPHPLWQVDVRSHLWQQPQDFAFRGARAMTGGLVAVRFVHTIPRFQPYLELSAKTKGWVAGEVEQGAGLSSIIGMRL